MIINNIFKGDSMNIESEIFKNTRVDYNKLVEYGFKKYNDEYFYSKSFMNNKFRADILVNNKGELVGKVYDLEFNEEYINIRIEMQNGVYVNKVREEYKRILVDIRDSCFIKSLYRLNQTNRICKYVLEKYNNEPIFLWDNEPHGVFRNKNKKWYGIIMCIDKSKLSNENGYIEIINVKLDENLINSLVEKNGFYRAYHMNKRYWITITLDKIISDEEIEKYIDISYSMVK